MLISPQFCHPDRHRSSQSDDLWSGGTCCCDVTDCEGRRGLEKPGDGTFPSFLLFAVVRGTFAPKCVMRWVNPPATPLPPPRASQRSTAAGPLFHAGRFSPRTHSQ